MNKPIETRCIHGNMDFSYQEATKAVSFPIYQTATFGHIALGQSTGFDYSREKNPNRQRLEETISACFDLFRPGDHIICSEDLYGGVIRLLQTIGQKNGLSVDYVDTTDVENIRAALRPADNSGGISARGKEFLNGYEI